MIVIKNCIICNEQFKDTTICSVRLYCNAKCKLIRDNKAKRIPHNFTKNCSICNTEFTDTAYRKKYCSVKCRNKFKMNNKTRKLFIKKYIASGKRQEVCRKYDQSDKGKKCNNYHVALRHARKMQAIPKWVGKEELKQIKVIYYRRKKGYHVDHIIPLKGINVCGLHVSNNLRIIKAKHNLIKGNRLTQT